jgi:hypothetical protein
MAKLSDVDREALERGLKLCREQSAEDADQINRMLADRPLVEVQQFACYSLQVENLGLRPWELAPCEVEDGKPVENPNKRDGALRAWELRARLIKAGLSVWEPSPASALHLMPPTA